MLWLDFFGVWSGTSKSILKGRASLWHDLMIWIKVRCVSVCCQAVFMYVLFLYEAGQFEAKHHFGLTWLNPAFIPTNSHTLISPHVRGVWLSLCKHCTHDGRLLENIRQLLIYRIISALYLLRQAAKVPDAGWAVYTESLRTISKAKASVGERPCARRDPSLLTLSLLDLEIQQYLHHIMTGYFAARHPLYLINFTLPQHQAEITLIQFWHPGQNYFMYFDRKCSGMLKRQVLPFADGQATFFSPHQSLWPEGHWVRLE